MAAHVTSAGEPRRSRNLAESVVSYVKQQIASEALKPGDKLPTESELMVGLGVSRTVVREGISRLQASEVIETRHGIGSFVLEPRRERLGIDMVPATTLRDVLSVLELRISLETESAGLAAQRAQPEDLARMRAALNAIEQTSRMGGDSVAADLQFHISVARATGNRYFVDILSQMGSALIPRNRIDSAGIAHADPKAYVALVNLEHESILDAISRHDSDGARAAMRMHLSNSRERLRRANETTEANS
ncbi:Predicted D-glucarate or D-galactorate regulator, GntR family [Caballeronia glathei]|jgi:DNA-binding FadR family transcriptional regulator|uniref:GntR family transcriptional regulator n=1 Tax=Caballeronia glathei TaxID=60547 RepID=A0A069PIZ6_9BURK|nr:MULTISPECIES: FadR/GntR family transcriptional regulator [Burkholderiaceae]KDR40663.1 GntR family transcriptional regulator [Caballeronia glathei]TCK35168.1 GntR family transcriptional regulator [Paraburkholderia sp. BL8N3]CDY74896.1 Predicted D-glucarate or D-galactorate regulator, GntR family [Caballeronia glathei]